MILVWIVSIDIYLLTDFLFSLLSIPTNISAGASWSIPCPSASNVAHLFLFCGRRGGLCECGFIGWGDAQCCQQREWSRRWEETVFSPWSQGARITSDLPPADPQCLAPAVCIASLLCRVPPALRLPQHPSRWCHEWSAIGEHLFSNDYPFPSGGLAVTPSSEQLFPAFWW